MRGNKKLWWSLTGVLAVFLVAIGVVWSFPVFKVSQFEVTGALNTDPAQVVAASGIAEGANLARVDASSAATQVVALPWVRSATVQRTWPGTVSIAVEEREAVLFSVEADGEHLIDAQGKPFLIDLAPEGAIEVIGALRQEPDALEAAAATVAALPDDVRWQVAQIDLPSLYEISLRLRDGREVFWGSTEQAADKALATRTALSREGSYFNVSNPQMVAVR